MSSLADFIHGKYPEDSFLSLVFKNFPSTMQQLFQNVNDLGGGGQMRTFQISKVEKVSSNPPQLNAQFPIKVGDLLQVFDENIWQSLAKNKPRGTKVPNAQTPYPGNYSMSFGRCQNLYA